MKISDYGNSEKIDVVILAGGKGSRIKKKLNNLPKPLIKIDKNRTFLDYLLNNICKYNFNKIYLLAGYKGKKIYNRFHRKKINLIPIECIIEKKQLGTAGSLTQIKNKISRKFLVLNGDTIFDINLGEFSKKNLNKNEILIALTKSNYKSHNTNLYNLGLNKNKIIYKNKSNLINAGVYLVGKKIFKYINKKNSSLENEIIPKLIYEKKAIGEVHNKFFIDIGTPKSLKLSRSILPKYFKKPAIFLDRDGTLNKFAEGKYIFKIRDFEFFPKTLKFLKKYTNNFYLFIITNQAGIGKKIFTEKDFLKLHHLIKSYLVKNKIYINDIKFSPFHPKAKIKRYKKISLYRKPGNLMIESIKKTWNIDLKKSFMIGDKLSDEKCSRKSNIDFFYFNKNLFISTKKKIN